MEEPKRILIDFFIRYGFQIIGATIILGTGVFIARWVGRILERLLGRREMEPPMRGAETPASDLALIRSRLKLAAREARSRKEA